MVNLFSFGCHVIDRATYVRMYASTNGTGGVGDTIKRKGGVSQACFGKSTSFIFDIHNMSIGHFRVPKNVTFKARLSAKPLL